MPPPRYACEHGHGRIMRGSARAALSSRSHTRVRYEGADSHTSPYPRTVLQIQRESRLCTQYRSNRYRTVGSEIRTVRTLQLFHTKQSKRGSPVDTPVSRDRLLEFSLGAISLGIIDR